MLFFKSGYVVLYSMFAVYQISHGFLNPHTPNIITTTTTTTTTTITPHTHETHLMFSKTLESKHQISDAIKSASYQLFLESERVEGLEHKIEGLSQDMHHRANDIGHEIGYMMVKAISAILPHVDTIGHKVLHMDDEIINYFLNLDSLSPELKKQIILGIIHISQQGDHIGAQMLQLYYDIVSKLM